MADMKWMSASVYGRRALSALAFAIAMSSGPVTAGPEEDEAVPAVALQADVIIAARNAAAIPRVK
jgi:hypothetical protein